MQSRYALQVRFGSHFSYILTVSLSLAHEATSRRSRAIWRVSEPNISPRQRSKCSDACSQTSRAGLLPQPARACASAATTKNRFMGDRAGAQGPVAGNLSELVKVE